jgi:hypothetical protein
VGTGRTTQHTGLQGSLLTEDGPTSTCFNKFPMASEKSSDFKEYFGDFLGASGYHWFEIVRKKN